MAPLPNPPNPSPPTAEAWLAANYGLLVTIARDVLRRGGAPAADADDVAQEAALAIWRHWADCRDDPTERARWAVVIAGNAARDRAAWYRRRPAAPLGAHPALAGLLYAGLPDDAGLQAGAAA